MKYLARFILLSFAAFVTMLGTTPLQTEAEPVEAPAIVQQEYKAPELLTVSETPITAIVERAAIPTAKPAPAAVRTATGYVDTYPAHLRDAPADTILDEYVMWNRECTSYAAWKIHQTTGYKIYGWVHAKFWAERARGAGKTVDTNPRVGSIAAHSRGTYGHVAIVERVGAGTVTVSHYNGDVTHGYSVTTYPTGHFTDYIHF